MVDAEQQVSRLGEAAERDDPAAAAAVAHSFRSASAALGAVEVVAACAELERAIAAGESIDLTRQARTVRDAVARATAALQEGQ